MFKKLFTPPFVILLATAISAGCQVTPTPPPTLTLSWTAASTCTGSNPSCTYIVSRATCTGATQSTCASTFTPLNQASPATGTSYTDSAPPTGSYVSYIAQTVQNFSGCPSGGCISVASGPSDSGVPTAVPSSPSAPSAPNATVTAGLAPPILPQAKPVTPIEMAGNKVAKPTGLTVRAGM